MRCMRSMCGGFIFGNWGPSRFYKNDINQYMPIFGYMLTLLITTDYYCKLMLFILRNY